MLIATSECSELVIGLRAPLRVARSHLRMARSHFDVHFDRPSAVLQPAVA